MSELNPAVGLYGKYFVLKPGGKDAYAAASRAAMAVYADLIYKADPTLARDMIAWIQRESPRRSADSQSKGNP